MKTLIALTSGLAGACTLTLIHESARRFLPDAPRMDLLGMRAIAQGLEKIDTPPPAPDRLHRWAMAGDIFSNSLYYSLTGTGKKAWLRGTVLGVAAGVGGVVLPGPLGLGTDASARTPQTQLMTVAWYLAGGLAAAAVSRMLSSALRK